MTTSIFIALIIGFIAGFSIAFATMNWMVDKMTKAAKDYLEEQ